MIGVDGLSKAFNSCF